MFAKGRIGYNKAVGIETYRVSNQARIARVVQFVDAWKVEGFDIKTSIKWNELSMMPRDYYEHNRDAAEARARQFMFNGV